MPSDLAYWLISAPLKDGDPNVLLEDVRRAIPGTSVAGWEVPELKTGTLSALLTLSDSLPKIDAQFTGVVSKCLDTLRSLTDPKELGQHARINDRPLDEYILPLPTAWRWDAGRWGSSGKVHEVVEALTAELNSIDQQQKQKTQSYNLAKGSLNNLLRKKTGNLSQRSLLDVIKKGDLVENSEFMETLLVAVPKNIIKEWEQKYERLTNMVVPRSSTRLAQDDEYFLQTVTVFKKVRDEYVHKCRENKFIVRDFEWDDDALEKQNSESAALQVEEKELWTELLKLTRINFSESYQLLAHLKTVRLFVESVLRYGLPADYAGVVIKPDPKTASRTLKGLQHHFGYLAAASQAPGGKSKGKGEKQATATAVGDDVGGEWAGVMEAEYFDFVLFEVPEVPI